MQKGYSSSDLGNIDSLIKCLEKTKLKLDEPMSRHTTLGVGGKADLFYVTENSGDLVKAVRLCRSFKVPVTVIGEGRGIAVSDLGIRGLVIRNKSERIQIKPQKSIFDFLLRREVKRVEVVIDSGVSIDEAIDRLVSVGIVGLEKLVELRGSIGAVVKNKEAGERLRRVSVLDDHGGVRSLGKDKDIGSQIVVDATFLLDYGKTEGLVKKIALVRNKRKRMFAHSAGEVFEDIEVEEQKTLGYPTKAASFVIGEVLNMKGYVHEKLMVSKSDGNVIINLGGGRATDFIELVEEIKSRAREAIGIELVEKVKRMGEL